MKIGMYGAGLELQITSLNKKRGVFETKLGPVETFFKLSGSWYKKVYRVSKTRDSDHFLIDTANVYKVIQHLEVFWEYGKNGKKLYCLKLTHWQKAK